MKVGKNFETFLYFWLPTGTNNKILAIGRIFFEIWRNWANVFMENPSYTSKSYFSGEGFGENSPVKETLVPSIEENHCVQ
jgi:hypothetical protein